MCRTAMSLAKRDAEKKLVLAALGGGIPTSTALKLAADTAEIASLKNDATKAVVVIVQKLGGDSPEMQQALARVGQKRVKIEIVKAEYGVDGKLKDVTDVVRQSVQGFPMLLLKTPVYGAAFGGDPAPGMVKQLRIEYRFDGKPGKATFSENAPESFCRRRKNVFGVSRVPRNLHCYAFDHGDIERCDVHRSPFVAIAKRQFGRLFRKVPKDHRLRRGIPRANHRRFAFDVRYAVKLRQ